MANILGWVIGIGLIVLVNMISVPIHDAFESRGRPPEAKSPRTAPWPVEVYYNAEVAESNLESDGDGLWHYSWKMTTKSDLAAVSAFYREKYPKAESAGDADYFEMRWEPEGAKEDEHVGLAVMSPEAADAPTTVVEISEFKQAAAGFVPSLFMIRAAMWGLLIGFLTLGQRPLAQLLGRFFVKAHMAKGGSDIQVLRGAPTPGATQSWRAPEATLSSAGFGHVFDVTVTNAGFPNAGRVLDREGSTQALLQHAVVNGKPYPYVEFQTHFADGSSVTTSTSKYASTLKRPDRHRLVQLPEETPVLEVLRRHDESVSAAGRPAAVIPADSLIETWKRIERECFENLEGGAPLTKEGLDVVAARPDCAPAVATASAAGSGAATAVVEAPPAVDDKAGFVDDVVARLQALDPNLGITRKDAMTLLVRMGNSQQDLDLETVYFMCRNNPADKDKILAGFLGRFAPKG